MISDIHIMDLMQQSSAGSAYTLSLHKPQDAYVLARSLQGMSDAVDMQRALHMLVFSHAKAVKKFLAYWREERAEISLWPEIDYWGMYRQSYPQNLMQQRMQFLWKLYYGGRMCCVTSWCALGQQTLPVDQLEQQRLYLVQGEEIRMQSLLAQLDILGYRKRSESIEGYGEYVHTNSCVEVFSSTNDQIVRLTICDDHLQSIACIDPLDTNSYARDSLQSLQNISLFPCTDYQIVSEADYSVCEQTLHEMCLNQEANSAQRQMYTQALHRREFSWAQGRYAGVFRRALRQKESTCVEHLLHSGRKVVIWDLATEESAKQAYLQMVSSARTAYELDLEESAPTVDPDTYYVEFAQLKQQLHKTACSVMLYPDMDISQGEDSQPPPLLAEGKNILRSPLESLKQQFNGTTWDAKSIWNLVVSGLRAGIDDVGEENSLHVYLGRTVDQNQLKLHKVVIAYKDVFARENLLKRWQQYGYSTGDISSLWNMREILQSRHSVLFVRGELPCDYELCQERILYLDSSHLLSSHEQFRKSVVGASALDSKKSAQHAGELQQYLQSLMYIQRGDLIVHRDHGVGRYLGLTHLSVGDHDVECLKIEYAGADKIYLPVDHISLLQKYDSSQSSFSGDAEKDGDDPLRSAIASDRHLDSLSRPQNWRKRKSKVKKAVQDLAEDILRVHSHRELQAITAYDAPCEKYRQFIEEFAYIETEDQRRFELDIEEDFRSTKAIDRLLIGDVGFGKTEMAMRACMRTVLQGYQVMVLCPTTVLCYQHDQTFRQRMAPHSVCVASVSRFSSASDLRCIVEDFRQGKIQILIGTHKLLSSIFQPQKLGLVIIDEEQRFGVMHKEKIKSLRAGAGVLSLSATPIPRTLHMSMLGLRDISLLTTPPEGRLPIKNTVSAWDDDLIRRALERECRRGGQVFFIHNRIDDLSAYAQSIRDLVPHMEVRIAHGRLPPRDLERVMLDFVQGKFPILLSTTIVESGIDMPHVNTICIHRAEHYGLSQLYQLRGRVGRSGVQAYAYLITSSSMKQLPEDARKRMQVMMNYQDLGAGFSIASYDMDMRGVGDLLGGEQSGHMATVGVEMYTQMLSESIKRARGEILEEESECDIQLSLSYGLCDKYMPRESLRLRWYRRLFHCSSENAISKWMQDIEHRHGPMPEQVQRLCKVARLKLSLKKLAAHTLKEKQRKCFELYIPKIPASRVDDILAALTRYSHIFSLKDSQYLMIYANHHHPKKCMLSQLYDDIQLLVTIDSTYCEPVQLQGE